MNTSRITYFEHTVLQLKSLYIMNTHDGGDHYYYQAARKNQALDISAPSSLLHKFATNLV
jgi:hypothetical protein